MTASKFSDNVGNKIYVTLLWSAILKMAFSLTLYKISFKTPRHATLGQAYRKEEMSGVQLTEEKQWSSEEAFLESNGLAIFWTGHLAWW